MTFATPGNLAVTYTVQEGFYERLGGLVHVSFRVQTTPTTGFTHTTAAGDLRLTGLPIAAIGERNGTMLWQGITKNLYTQIVPRTGVASTILGFGASGSAQIAASVVAADMPTGGTVRLEGDIWYAAA